MTIQRASLIVAFLVTAGAVPMSHAVAATTVLGPTVCVRAGTVGAAGNGLVYETGRVTNTTVANADVVCSLFRDNTTNTNGMQDMEMAIDDPTPMPGTFSCDAISLDRKGLTKKFANRKSTIVGEQVLDWGGSVNASVAKGHYAVRCTIPPGGSIHSIYYLEP
jgi:hypothetical protein